jgi:hypothetical protein
VPHLLELIFANKRDHVRESSIGYPLCTSKRGNSQEEWRIPGHPGALLLLFLF